VGGAGRAEEDAGTGHLAIGREASFQAGMGVGHEAAHGLVLDGDGGVQRRGEEARRRDQDRDAVCHRQEFTASRP
jgi:hypothetical protein